MRPNIDGHTDDDGEIYIDPSWSKIACFSKSEYHNLFFTLFHESMHSTDFPFTLWTYNEAHHNRIFAREIFEAGRTPRRPMPGPGQVWGTPKENPVDVDRMYENYKKRTPACDCSK